MSDAQLTAHFALHEFLYSETAARMGLSIEPTDAQIANASRLARTILEPVRVELGRPLTIISGIRPLWLNDAVGGSKTSAHIDGRAADVRVVGMSTPTFFRWLMNRSLPFDQVIEEFGQWVHIGIAKESEKPRGQFLIARKINGSTQYQEAA